MEAPEPPPSPSFAGGRRGLSIRPGRGTPFPRIFSPHAQLLPYLEQDSLRSTIDLNSPPVTFDTPTGILDGSVNYPAATTRISIFLCPSDPAQGRIQDLPFGATNYSANAGSGTLHYGSLQSADGIFYSASQTRLVQVADGASNTTAFAERPLGRGAGGTTDPQPWQTVIREIPANAAFNVEACVSPVPVTWYTERGAKWILGNYGNTLYNHFYPPNASSWDCMNQQQQQALMTARSFHPEGVMVLLCDGSTHFVADTIELTVWHALATRFGGESVSLP